MPPEKALQAPRRRAGAPKVKTGCRTCKIRHVKCDERKPLCVRCQTAGVVCDGYPELEQTKAMAKITTGTPVASDRMALISREPSSPIVADEQERRGFDFYQSQTAQVLTGLLGRSFWCSGVLQMTHSDLAIRHAVIAVGSLGVRLDINHVLTAENEEANARHRFACHQYQTAINHLRTRMTRESEPSMTLTLTSCFLLLCFEFLQSNEEAFLVHLKSGLDLIHYDHVRRIKYLPNGRTVETSTNGPIPELVEVFGIVNAQARRWLGLQSCRAELTSEEGEASEASEASAAANVEPIILEPFASLRDADRFLHRETNMHHYWRGVEAHDWMKQSDSGPPTAIAMRQDLLQQHEKWPQAMEDLLTRCRADFRSHDWHRVTILRIKHKIITVMLNASLEPFDKKTYRQFDPEFEQVISLATSLLRPNNVIANTPLSTSLTTALTILQGPLQDSGQLFTFTEGVIHALYYTAIKCCNRSIYQQALSLLSGEPWREGVWDSVAAANVANRKIRQREQEGWYSD